MFSSSPLSHLPSHYQPLSQLGRGAFGVTYKIRHRLTNQLFCAKAIDLRRSTPQQKQSALRQVCIEILKKMDYQHVVRYVDSVATANQLIIIMEFYGDLRRHIDKRAQTKSHFTQTLLLNWLLQLLSSLSYIHSKSIIHRDIKPQNIFLDSSAMIKIGDFGVSKILDSTLHSVTTAGSHCYMSPQMIQGKKYSGKTDVWSLGCVMWELASLVKPFMGRGKEKKMWEVGRRIVEEEVGSLPGWYSGLLGIVVGRMLVKQQEKRPSVREFLMDGRILEIMTMITRGSMRGSGLREELERSLKGEQTTKQNEKAKEKQKKQVTIQSPKSSREHTIAKIFSSAKLQIQQKLSSLKKLNTSSQIHQLQLRINQAFQQLSNKVQKGFLKLKNDTQNGRNFTGSSENPFEESSSLDTETIKSVLLGQRTLREMQEQVEELEYSKTGTKLEFGTILSRQADFNGLTITNQSSILGSTIKSDVLGVTIKSGTFSGSLKQTLRETLKREQQQQGFGDTLRSEYQNTIKQSVLSNTIQSGYEKSFGQGMSLKSLDNEIKVLKALAKGIEEQPEILRNSSALEYTLSNAGTIDLTLLSNAGISIKSRATFQDIQIQQAIQHIQLGGKTLNKQKQKSLQHELQKEKQLSFERKKSTNNSAVDRNKEMKDILELYKAQLEKASGEGNKKNFLILSEIPEEVNEASAMTSQRSSIKSEKGIVEKKK